MTTVYLALRHRDPTGLKGLFAKLIRWRLVTAYPHAGIVIGAALYHSTLADGVHVQDAPTAADYCFEFSGFVCDGVKPASRVTAEQLLALVAQQLAEQQPLQA